MGAVINLANWRRRNERRAHRLEEMPVELMELILVAEMNRRHQHLDELLEDTSDQNP